MKRIKQALAVAGFALAIASCQNPEQHDEPIAKENENTTGSQRYIDPNTGAPVDLYYNAHEKMTYNRENDNAVDFYVNTNTGDTVYGRGRYIVNGYIIRGEDGKYMLDDTKVKIEDGELKIKDENGKLKIDDDEMKYKEGDYKKKVDGDEIKIKTDDKKIKKEKGEPTKVKEDN